MVKRKVYSEVKKLQKKGMTKNRISQVTGLNIRTVRKYWDMDEEEYQGYLRESQYREKEFDGLKEEVLEIYKQNDNMKLPVSAVYDYLEETKTELPATEATLRNFVHYLIQSGELVINSKQRKYTQVPQMPYGKQLQIDFGEYQQKNGTKLYIMGAVLSSSRYKYAALQERNFRTEDLIGHLMDCFDYIGGLPEEIVIDQDSTMVVSENSGDIIYTKQFDDFRKEMGFKMWVCRAADPESKGMIENFIKYIKYNFFTVREFNDLSSAQNSLLRWLERRANGRISQSTKKIPAIEIEEERKYLKAVRPSIHRKEKPLYREERTVSDKSRITIDASFYEVPEAYRNGKVEIYKILDRVFIYDRFTGKELVNYPLSTMPGKLISDQKLARDMGKKITGMREEVLAYFELTEWKEFLAINFRTFDRYQRDQCRDAKKYFKDPSEPIGLDYLRQSLRFCLENKTYSISNLHDSYEYFKMQDEKKDLVSVEKTILSMYDSQDRSHFKDILVTKPDSKVYETVLSQSGGEI